VLAALSTTTTAQGCQEVLYAAAAAATAAGIQSAIGLLAELSMTLNTWHKQHSQHTDRLTNEQVMNKRLCHKSGPQRIASLSSPHLDDACLLPPAPVIHVLIEAVKDLVNLHTGLPHALFQVSGPQLTSESKVCLTAWISRHVAVLDAVQHNMRWGEN
jgi:hypothetical protein